MVKSNDMRFWSLFARLLKLGLILLLATLLLGSSTQPLTDRTSRARAFTREIEFDFVSWTLDALGFKIQQWTLGTEGYLTPEARRQMMLEYLQLTTARGQLEGQISAVFADPNESDPQTASRELRQQFERVEARRLKLEPVAEAVLEGQVASVVAEMGLTLGGQPVPPVLYHSTPLPLALIISPRDKIFQETSISLSPELDVDQFNALEAQVDEALNMSSLIVYIGGIGLYPSMVYQTDSLNGLSEVVAHEWIHNFLILRPLGINYFTSPELRVMNETTASIAGKEIGRAVLERYYPELVPPPPPPAPAEPPAASAPPPPPVFDFYAEMRETRVTVDALLAEGKIEEAEAYMEQRRVVFWENGYRHLRKLNQAYFAFHGAYADHPSGGAAGADPVGAAVRLLRAQSPTLADFVKRMSWMSSFEQLQRAVDETDGKID